jgi:hypothetical protein
VRHEFPTFTEQCASLQPTRIASSTGADRCEAGCDRVFINPLHDLNLSDG